MKINDSDIKLLLDRAEQARKASYCPYSGFAVGAALLTASGKIYTGANIENASYTPTVCAERVALFTALHAGERDFTAIAVVGARADEVSASPFPPCGVCRQVMAEFCDPDMAVILKNGEGADVYTLAQLLPVGFGKNDLK